ncbi:MAG: ATP-binding cassette domain-containing protein [Mogibacterium sp.]|nr:ATP-binding cassette domain-containing protein [Mogibacterium sp.]MBR2706603.1 ATP-binding cassette domain-containing protein [Mogibacterium sp.]
MSGQVRNDARSGGALLRIENGNFAYKSGPQILKDINIEVGPGEILAVLGPNGAGKTTLLRCMMDMLHWQSGRSLLDGEDIRSIPASKLWRRMAYVPQARSAAVSYTAFQTVLLGRSSRIGAFSAPSAEDMKIAESVMERLGISHLADKACYAISGGELQMVLIARAMAAEPEILVLDEPESNLDFKNQLIVLDAMTALAAEGVACIFNTHYPAHALQRAGKALMLSKDGRSIFGDTTSVVTEENIRHAFGVDALIGEVETPHNIMKNVVAVGISEDGAPEAADGAAGAAASEKAGHKEEAILASITVIMRSNERAALINSAFRDYNHLLIGRMGLPHRRSEKYIISVMLEGPAAEIDALSHRLSLIPDISVKTTYE